MAFKVTIVSSGGFPVYESADSTGFAVDRVTSGGFACTLVSAGAGFKIVTMSGGGSVAPSNTVAPSISGSPVVGSTLTANNGTWAGSLPITYTYQWLKGGVNISGATAQTYVPVTGDIGGTITVTVTGTNTSGNASATSAGVGPVAAASSTLGQPMGLLLALTYAS